jgi:hypothetical protein
MITHINLPAPDDNDDCCHKYVTLICCLAAGVIATLCGRWDRSMNIDIEEARGGIRGRLTSADAGAIDRKFNVIAPVPNVPSLTFPMSPSCRLSLSGSW